MASRGRSRPGATRQLPPSSGGAVHASAEPSSVPLQELSEPSSVPLHELSELLVVSQLPLDAAQSEPAEQASQKLGPSGGGGGGGEGGGV